MKIKEYFKTCSACPAQWEGTLEDGRIFYSRYRHGRLFIEVSKLATTDQYEDIPDENMETLCLKQIGGEFHGELTDEDFKFYMLAHNFTFSEGDP